MLGGAAQADESESGRCALRQARVARPGSSFAADHGTPVGVSDLNCAINGRAQRTHSKGQGKSAIQRRPITRANRLALERLGSGR